MGPLGTPSSEALLRFSAVIEAEAQGVLAFPFAFALSHDLPCAATSAKKRLGTRQGVGGIS